MTVLWRLIRVFEEDCSQNCRRILSRTPAGRWGQPEEIAGTAVYLASRASDFVTGETIRVDGGYAIR
jgi:NAD(P)-dependent dehydrogenase (short-subunit alcohol dehydrogenase family)